MAFFSPTGHIDKITDLTPEILEVLGVNTVLADIDNTLKRYGSQEPYEGVEQWIEEMHKNGVKIIICSNNYKSAVEPFAKRINLPFVHMCLKPSPFGFYRAKRKTKAKRREILVVGDQLFTDIFGANISFMKSVLVEPIETSDEAKTVALRRFLESRQRTRILKRKNPF